MLYVAGIITGILLAIFVAILHVLFRISVPREVNKVINEVKKTVAPNKERGSFLETENTADKIKQIMKQ